jgi:hypothetical protein
MEETYIIILIIAILILILYFVNFSGKQNNTNRVVPGANQSVISNQPPAREFKSYNPTENFGSCNSQITQQVSTTKSDKSALKVYITYWCGWSKKLLAQLGSDAFKNKFKEVDSICVIDIIDCDVDKEKCDPLFIKGFPTIKLQTKDGKLIPYDGNRSNDDLINFIKSNQ